MRVTRRSASDTVPQDNLAEDARLLRFAIISLLYQQGDWLAERIIRGRVESDGLDMSRGKLGMQFGYLQEEGLIEKMRKPLGDIEFTYWKLTPLGIDVYEGNATHPGVAGRHG